MRVVQTRTAEEVALVPSAIAIGHLVVPGVHHLIVIIASLPEASEVLRKMVKALLQIGVEVRAHTVLKLLALNGAKVLVQAAAEVEVGVLIFIVEEAEAYVQIQTVIEVEVLIQIQTVVRARTQTVIKVPRQMATESPSVTVMPTQQV